MIESYNPLWKRVKFYASTSERFVRGFRNIKLYSPSTRRLHLIKWKTFHRVNTVDLCFKTHGHVKSGVTHYRVRRELYPMTHENKNHSLVELSWISSIIADLVPVWRLGALNVRGQHHRPLRLKIFLFTAVVMVKWSQAMNDIPPGQNELQVQPMLPTVSHNVKYAISTTS